MAFLTVKCLPVVDTQNQLQQTECLCSVLIKILQNQVWRYVVSSILYSSAAGD